MKYKLYVTKKCMVCRNMLNILPDKNIEVVYLDDVKNHSFYQLPVLISDKKVAYSNPNDIRFIFNEIKENK